MIDVSTWHTMADNPPERVPVLCYCEASNEIFIGFEIHPYVALNRTVNIVKWYYQPRLHQWFEVTDVTRWRTL